MRNFRLASIGAASLVLVLAGTSANAAVAPNGSFSYSTPGPNTVDTGSIGNTTTSLTLGNSFPGFLVTTFTDPYLGQPNNFCGAAGGGCTAEHPPGFLFPGSFVELTNLTLPVGNTSPTPIAETVTASTNFGVGGQVEVNFDFTSVSTTALSDGSLALNFLGTVASNNTNEYTLGQSASMTINCTGSALEGGIGCTGTIATPTSAVVPEPTSLVLLGSAIFGFGVLRRRFSPAPAAL